MQWMRIGGFGESCGAQDLNLRVFFTLMEWSTELGGVGAPFISTVENIDVGVLHYLTSLIGTGQVRRNSNSKLELSCRTSSVRELISPVDGSGSRCRTEQIY
jgi:hypothetical protein